MSPPKFPDEPPSDPPFLNRTANWLLGDASFLFANIIESCGYATAKFIFEKCIKEAAEIEAQRERARGKQAARYLAPLLELPPIAEIDVMDREQVCRWYRRFARTDQAYDERSRRLLDRYLSFGGQPNDFNSNLPPIKPKGARNHKAPGAELPALFAAERNRNTRLSNPQIAEIIVKKHGTKYGKNAEAVERTERNWRNKNRKI
jgi:hypothetical protein